MNKVANKSVIKIAVAEESPVIRMGVVAALKRVAGSSAILFEIARPADFNTRIKSYQPDVLIVDPHFSVSPSSLFDVTALRADSDLEMSSASVVALLSSPFSKQSLDAYDSWLSVYDSEDELKSLLDSLLKTEPVPLEDEEEQLSAREKEVVRYVVKGLANKEIADVMNISLFTVLTHRRNISRKLKIHSSIALAIYAISNKIATVDEVK